MNVTEKQFITLFENISALEENKKDISAEIKDNFEAFAESNELNKKSVIAGYKAWKAAQKDEAEFILVDSEVSEILNRIIKTYRENDTNAAA